MSMKSEEGTPKSRKHGQRRQATVQEMFPGLRPNSEMLLEQLWNAYVFCDVLTFEKLTHGRSSEQKSRLWREQCRIVCQAAAVAAAQLSTFQVGA